MVTAVFGTLIGLLLAGALLERRGRRRDPRPAAGRRIVVGGARVHVDEAGAGTPTVVLLHGAGDSSASWIAIRKEVSAFARVVSHDRLGLGASDDRPAGAPVDFVGELRAVLEGADVRGPVVFVGHSLGGLIARQYARTHPGEVAGFVFVDSTHEFLNEDANFHRGFAAVGVLLKVLRALSPFGVVRLAARLGAIPMYPERTEYVTQLSADERRQWEAAAFRNFAGAGAGAEFRAVFPLLDDAAKRLATTTSPEFGSLPLAVVSNPGFGEAWTTMQRELSTRSTRGTHVVSDRPGHNVQMRRPELVVEAIREVLEDARSERRAG